MFGLLHGRAINECQCSLYNSTRNTAKPQAIGHIAEQALSGLVLPKPPVARALGQNGFEPCEREALGGFSGLRICGAGG